MSPTMTERRVCTVAFEVRADGDAPKLSGYAARFNSPADIGGWFREQIAPGAFSKAIPRDDVRALFNHDPNMVLGRNRAGTLKLSEDDQGLQFEVNTPDTTWARDLVTSVKRGDISQCSFQFEPVDEEWDYSEDTPSRTLREVSLIDVSVVTFPAYDVTSVSARALERAKSPPIVRATPGQLARARIAAKRLERLKA